MGDLIDITDPEILFDYLGPDDRGDIRGKILGLLCRGRDLKTLYSHLNPAEKQQIKTMLQSQRAE